MKRSVPVITLMGADQKATDAFKTEFEEAMKDPDKVMVTNFTVVVNYVEIADEDEGQCIVRGDE